MIDLPEKREEEGGSTAGENHKLTTGETLTLISAVRHILCCDF